MRHTPKFEFLWLKAGTRQIAINVGTCIALKLGLNLHADLTTLNVYKR